MDTRTRFGSKQSIGGTTSPKKLSRVEYESIFSSGSRSAPEGGRVGGRYGVLHGTAVVGSRIKFENDSIQNGQKNEEFCLQPPSCFTARYWCKIRFKQRDQFKDLQRGN